MRLPLALAAATAIAAIASHAKAASVAPNTVEITPKLVTAGQPSREALAKLSAQGFGAVIYLAPPTSHNACWTSPSS